MSAFLPRFALYALSAIIVSAIALLLLSLCEKRLKSSAALLLITLLLIRIFLPTGFFGISLFTLSDTDPASTDTPITDTLPTPSEPTVVPTPSPVPTPTPPADTPSPQFWKKESANAVAMGIVFGISLLSLTIYFTADAITRRRLKKRAVRITDPELLSLYTKLAEARHLDKLPALYASPAVTSPCLVGLISPRIYIATDSKYDSDTLFILLSHELEHYRKGDLYVKFFALSIVSFQWWNPFLPLLVKKLDLYLEQACDERVLKNATADEVLSYTELMLSICKQKITRKKREEKLTAYFSSHAAADIKKRLSRLLDGKVRSRGIFLILAVVLIAISTLFLVGFAPTPSPDTTDPPAITTETPSTADDLYPPTDNPDALVPAEKEGHTFSHWENIVTENGDTFLKAIYTPNTYTVTLSANGGKIKEQQTLTFSETLPAPTREGYTFGGWYSDAALTQPITAVPAKDITVYAYWREETPTAYFTYEIYQGAVMITAAKASDSIVMPAYIGGLPVAHIGKYAFENATVTDIVLPYTLQTIGVGAFYNCRRLQTVTLFEGIRYIDRVAFDACYALSSIYYHGSEASWQKVEGKDSSLPIRYR